jgi:transcriptional regulator with XRE-family HTH domain
MSKQGGWVPTGFGGRLRVLRERAGWTQRELADQAGCNQFTVAKLERGLQEPAWPLVLALGRALGVTCLAFDEEAADEPQEKRGPGRPPERKQEAEGGAAGKPGRKPAKPKKGRNKPK